MGYAAVRWVLQSSKTTGTARMVMLVIAEHLHHDRPERGTFVGIETIAAEANCHRASVIRAIQEAEATGELEVARRARGRSNVYTLPQVASCDVANHDVANHDVASGEPRGRNLRGVRSHPARLTSQDATLISSNHQGTRSESAAGEAAEDVDSEQDWITPTARKLVTRWMDIIQPRRGGRPAQKADAERWISHLLDHIDHRQLDEIIGKCAQAEPPPQRIEYLAQSVRNFVSENMPGTTIPDPPGISR